MTACRSWGERGLNGSLRSGRRRGLSGAPWYRLDRPLVVPSLDVPMPQMENQLIEAAALDLPIPEQAIEVPKISSSSRYFLRAPGSMVQQTAELLVEVPTIVSFRSLHGLVEQNVDIPVPHGRGGGGGLQDVRSGQDSAAFCGAEHVGIPVPCGGGLQGFLPRQVSTTSSSHSWCCG